VINQKCPFSLDKETRLDNVLPMPNKTLRYNCTLVNYTRAELDVSVLKEEIEPKAINKMRTDPSMELFKENEVTIESKYNDRNGIYLMKITITPEKYLN
jgi:hypothetical protein